MSGGSKSKYHIIGNFCLQTSMGAKWGGAKLGFVQRKLLQIISVDLDVTGRLLIIYSAFVKYLRKNGNTMRHCISYL